MKKVLLIAIVSIMFICLVYQGSVAFFRAETNIGTKISAGELGIQLIETSNEEEAKQTSEGYHFTSAMPGMMIDNKAYIKNVKDKSLYVRITVKRYWEDIHEKKIKDADSSLIQLYTENKDDWIIIDDAESSNSENIYFYYKKQIKAAETSENIFDGIQISSELDDLRYRDYQIRVKLEAEAIQSAAAQDAVLSEWGVEINLDEQGNIISVIE